MNENTPDTIIAGPKITKPLDPQLQAFRDEAKNLRLELNGLMNEHGIHALGIYSLSYPMLRYSARWASFAQQMIRSIRDDAVIKNWDEKSRDALTSVVERWDDLVIRAMDFNRARGAQIDVRALPSALSSAR